MLFALIFLPELIHGAARFACDSGPTCKHRVNVVLLVQL